MEDGCQYAMEGTAKLHGIGGSQRQGVGVDGVESVVHDGARATGKLGDDTKGAEP